MQSLGELLKYLGIKQINVWRTLRDRYGLDISLNNINYLCNKEGHWFSKRAAIIQEAIEKEYGIYYDGAVWKGGINYVNK